MEEKKISIFKKIENNVLAQVIFFVVSMAVIVGAYVVIQQKIDKMFEIVNDDFSWVYQVDSIKETDGKLVLEGWAFELNTDAKEEVFEVFLYDEEKGKTYYPEVVCGERDDVNQYFLCEYDYTQSGFEASIDISKLDIENAVYEILIRPEGNRNVYSAGYCAAGELVFVNPNEFVSLQVKGTDLERIVEDGIIRVYRPDVGMYVYQYDGELYWIAEKDVYFEQDANPYIQYQLYTTQIENLPQQRLENEWYWDNIGFYFESREVTFEGVTEYRVAVKELPTAYSITKILTGYNDKNTWVWKQNFIPYYGIMNKH